MSSKCAECPSCRDCMTGMSAWFGVIDIGVACFVAAAGVNATMGLQPDQLFLGVCLLLAGVLIGLLSIADCVPISQYFLFLKRFWGRGALYVFFGILCVNGSFWRILFGGGTVAVGLIYCMYACAFPSVTPQPLSGCTLCDSVADPRAGPSSTVGGGLVVTQQPGAGRAGASAGPFAKEAETGAPRPFHESGAGGAAGATTTSGHRGAPKNRDNPFHSQQQQTPFDQV